MTNYTELLNKVAEEICDHYKDNYNSGYSNPWDGIEYESYAKIISMVYGVEEYIIIEELIARVHKLL